MKVDLNVLMSEAELAIKDLLSGGLALDGVRSFEALLEGDGVLVASGGVGKLFLDFGAGNCGRGPEGGFAAGCDG